MTSFTDALRVYHATSTQKFGREFSFSDLLTHFNPVKAEIEKTLRTDEVLSQNQVNNLFAEISKENAGFPPMNIENVRRRVVELAISPGFLAMAKHAVFGGVEEVASDIGGGLSDATKNVGKGLQNVATASKLVLPMVFIAIAVVAVLAVKRKIDNA